MDVEHLLLLRELAERGSVTAVAQATHRTPSAVSQQLRTAQRHAGMALVEPDGRGLRLTEAGLLLARGGVEVASALARVESDWRAFRDGPGGEVRIAALPSAATFLLPAVQRAAAEVGLVLRVQDDDVAEADFAALAADHDLVIGHSVAGPRPAGSEGLVATPLAREPLDVALAAGHPLAAKARLRVRDVVDQEWIGVPAGYPFDTVLAAIEHEAGVPLRVTQRVRDNRLVEALVSSSRLLAVLPRFTTPVAPPGADGVVLRPLVAVRADRFVTALARPDRAQRAAVRHTLDLLRTAAAEVSRRHHAPPC